MRLLSVVRDPLSIVALLTDRAHPFDPDDDTADDAPYRQHRVPLSHVPEAFCPWRDKDLRAWRALARVPSLSRRAGAAIVRSMIGSVADPERPPGELAAIDFGPGVFDLRPHLCAPDSEQAILDRLGDVLEEVSSAAEFPRWHWTHRAAIAMLPAPFRLQFLWGLHLSTWSQLELTLAVYEALELDAHDHLRLAVARLLSLADRAAGLAWARALLEVEPAARARACEIVIETEAYRGAPGEDARRALRAREWAAVVAP